MFLVDKGGFIVSFSVYSLHGEQIALSPSIVLIKSTDPSLIEQLLPSSSSFHSITLLHSDCSSSPQIEWVDMLLMRFLFLPRLQVAVWRHLKGSESLVVNVILLNSFAGVLLVIARNAIHVVDGTDGQSAWKGP